MGVPELITRMQEIYRQAEAQLQHVEPLERSSTAWAATAQGLADTSDLLRRTGGQVAPGWPDDVGALYTERLEKSGRTVQMWQDTLAAADLPATVTALAQAIRTTADGVRELWNTFVQAVGQLSIEGIDAAGVEAALQAIVDRAAALLAELDALFAEAAARVAGAADGTAWDGPAAAGAAGGGAAGAAAGGGAAGGAGPTAAGSGAAAAARGGGAPAGGGGSGGAPAPAGVGGLPAPAGVGGLPSPAGVGGLPSPIGVPGGIPAPTPVGGPGLAGLPPLTPVAPSPAGGLPPLSGLAGLGGGGAGGGGVGPMGVPSVGGAAAAAGGQIPRAGRRLVGAPPLAGGAMPAAAGAAGGTSGATGGSSRFFPPVGGMGQVGGRSDGDVKPGDEKSTHQARPLQAIPGVPPSLRGRAGTLDATPDFLTGAHGEEPEPAEPLREDLWEAARPANPFTGGR